jgi:predicted metal-dependent HD superfamily phosphohydrolase
MWPSLLAWVDDHNGAVVAIATCVNVIVAAFYAVVTVGLWRVAGRTLALNQQAVTDTRTQAEAAAAAATAATEQARIAQRMFEATHRPYIAITPQAPDVPSMDAIVARFMLDNRGAVPAVLTRWKHDVRQGSAIVEQQDYTAGPNAALTVFPGLSHPATLEIPTPNQAALRVGREAMRFEIAIDYRGFGDRDYRTTIVTEFRFTPQRQIYETLETRFE